MRLPGFDDLTDELLTEALSRRDQRALAALYDRHARAAYSLALRVIGDHQRAEDVVQEVFLKIWREPSLYHVNRGSFRSWLLAVVRNRSIDYLRVGSHELVPGGDSWTEAFWATIQSEEDDPADRAIQILDGEIVASALERLPADLRSVIEMAYYGGLSQSEIAREIGAPLGTVKTRIRTGMLRLREMLAALAPEGRAGAV